MKKFILFIFVIIISNNYLFSQETKAEAIYIYNFARILKWPEYNNSTDFNIKVINDTRMVEDINNYVINKTIYGKKITAIDADINDLSNCEIIYIPFSKSSLLPEILLLTTNKNILIVTEEENLVSQGAGVSFIWTFDINGFETLNYQYNEQNIKSHNIRLSTEFKGYGIPVNEIKSE